MAGNENMQNYLTYMEEPWSRLFYELIWHHLECEGKKILDFGSGFGKTADHLAEKNEVIAVEPNGEMLEHRYQAHAYQQILGGIEQLKQFPDRCFDIIVCHNVLEYVQEREEVLQEFSRLLKPEGFVSIVKHNKFGKIMQKAVFEYKIEEALQLLSNENMVSANFGIIREYEDQELERYSEGKLLIDHIYGIRTFFALQRNELKTGADWFEDMFRLERKVEEITEFRNIAFSHHVILKHRV